MRSWIKVLLVTLGCASWLFLSGYHHEAVANEENKPVRNQPRAEPPPSGGEASAEHDVDLATQPSRQQREAYVFRLNNRQADQVGCILREGLTGLSDGIEVVFDKLTNTVVIQAGKDDRERLAYLVAQVDKPERVETDEDPSRVTKVFELKHTKAAAVAEAVAGLYPRSRAVNSWDMVTVEVTGELGPVAIGCDSHRVAELSALIALLDTADSAHVQITRAFSLNQSDAEDLAAPLAELTKQAGIRCRVGPNSVGSTLTVQADVATLGIVTRLLKHFDRSGWPINESRLLPEARAKARQEREARGKASLLLDEPTEKVIADAGSADSSLALRVFDTLAVRLCLDALTVEQCTAVAEAALNGLTRAPSRSATEHVCVMLLDDLRLRNRLTDEQRLQFFDSLITVKIKTRPESVMSVGIPATLTVTARGRGVPLWFVIDLGGGLGIPGGPLSGGFTGYSGPAEGGCGCGGLLKPRGLGPETIHATLNAKIYEWSFTGDILNGRPALPAMPLHRISREITAQTTVVEQEPPDYLKVTSDPALEQQVKSAISVRKVSQRPWGLEVDIFARKSPVDLAVTVVAVAGDRKTKPVSLRIPRNVDDNYPTGLGEFPDVTHVDILLTPDPELAKRSVDFTEIWGKPIRFEHVPVVDKTRATTTGLSPARLRVTRRQAGKP